jgi:hypothetical protein
MISTPLRTIEISPLRTQLPLLKQYTRILQFSDRAVFSRKANTTLIEVLCARLESPCCPECTQTCRGDLRKGLKRPGFDPIPLYVGLVVKEVAPGLAYLKN